jgi:hypothetical protein
MSSTPIQYQNNLPTKKDANLSPLQLAAAYYMDQGQQTPFFINHEFLKELKTFMDSGIITPPAVGVPGGISVVVENNQVYVIRRASDCGPEETDRYEKVSVGPIGTVAPSTWTFNAITVRGGSAANGAGGPWGTGGLTSQDPTPENSVNREPNIVTNVYATYGATSTTATNGIA